MEIVNSKFDFRIHEETLRKLGINEIIILQPNFTIVLPDGKKLKYGYVSKNLSKKKLDELSYIIIDEKLNKQTISSLVENKTIAVFSMFDLIKYYKNSVKSIRLCHSFKIKIILANCTTDVFWCRSERDRKAIINWILKN